VIRHTHFRKAYQPQNIEDAFRLTLLYSVNIYKGDEKIKSFVWDLITPKEYGDKVSMLKYFFHHR
jgi:chromodomain-helicase-DNA-binding protein 7